jgi:hypothetical protein
MNFYITLKYSVMKHNIKTADLNMDDDDDDDDIDDDYDDDDDDNNNNNNNNNNSCLSTCRVNSQMANYRNSTTYQHK